MSLAAALRQAAKAERREMREQLMREVRRLGRCRQELLGNLKDGEGQVQWESGDEEEQLETLRTRISDQRQCVEKVRKSLTGRKPGQQQDGTPSGLSQEELDEEIWEQRELCNLKLSAVARDEQELREREQRLHADRAEHAQHMKAVEAEDSLDFTALPLLQQRYQLLRVLSKKGNTTVTAPTTSRPLPLLRLPRLLRLLRLLHGSGHYRQGGARVSRSMQPLQSCLSAAIIYDLSLPHPTDIGPWDTRSLRRSTARAISSRCSRVW